MMGGLMKKINFYTVITLLLSASGLQNVHASLANGSILNFTAALAKTKTPSAPTIGLETQHFKAYT